MTWLLVAVGGGLGAVARMWLGTVVERVNPLPVPLGTLLINVTGSFALGVLTAVVADHLADPVYAMVLGTGFLGGYTTFSTASVETARLVEGERRSWLPAVAYAAAILVLSVGAALAGYLVG